MCRHISKPAFSRKALFCFAVLSLLWMGPAGHAQQPPRREEAVSVPGHPLAPADDPVIVPDQVDQWESDIVKLALAAGRYLMRLVGSEDASLNL
jgi:hypothetical protein